jgi:hypothetical protein
MTEISLIIVRFNYIRKLILLIFPVFFILQSCSTADVKESSFSDFAYIEPGDSYEECVELVPNQLMHYSFTSSKNVNFNVHYHDDKSIFYPVNEKNITFWKDSISPDDFDYYSQDQEFFCLMWDNLNSENVKIIFTYNVNTK